MNKIESGTIIQGTLREEDLLEAFACELETLVKYKQKLLRLTTPLGIAHYDWQRVIGHKHLIAAARDCLILRDERPSAFSISDVVNELIDALNEYAPDDMYFGTLEGDGADFGWWYIESEVQA